MIDTFRPLFEAATGIDLTRPESARAQLEARLDPASDEGRELSQALVALYEEGRVADRGQPPVRWSRVSGSEPETADFSIDVVHMNGAGPLHRHPEGEVNYCIALDGEPRFDGQPPGWVVFPPDSSHVPTVEGGTMLIVYLLPKGAIEFVK